VYEFEHSKLERQGKSTFSRVAANNTIMLAEPQRKPDAKAGSKTLKVRNERNSVII